MFKKKKWIRREAEPLKKISVLPSLLTLGNTFCGFLAIVKVADAASAYALGDMPSFTVKLETAVLLIFLAMVFDALDGKVARLTHQASDFGAHLDSLSDAITFGVAPAALAKVLIEKEGVKTMPFLEKHPRILFLAAAIYALFAVMRLARFNVESMTREDKSHDKFKGLPTPGAGGLVAALVLFWLHRNDELLSSLPAFMFDAVIRALPWLLVIIGLAMISPLPYPHMMNTLFKRRKSFLFLSGFVFALVIATISYELALAMCMAGYFVSGFVWGIKDVIKGLKTRRHKAKLLKGPRSAAG